MAKVILLFASEETPLNARLFDFAFATRMYDSLAQKVTHQILFPVKIFCFFPKPAPCFGQIRYPEITLPDAESKASVFLYYETLRLALLYK